MYLKQFRTGGDRNFGYLIADEASGEALVADPSYSPSLVVDEAREQGFTIRYVFCTHGHHDHVNGNEEIAELTGLQPLLYGSVCPRTGRLVEDGAVFPLGSLDITILHTPGHTEDSICLLAGDAVLTGDTLFVGKIGGTATHEEAAREFRSLHERLMQLDDRVRVFPGHDYGSAPQSTIGQEKKTNPFLLQPDLDSFCDLKKNWAAYKRRHGIV
ncbi:MBL fold metallo-hydrolase [Prosthecochloris sp. N3]|uniref:MBL fold metallo-hydrolase n=1 Tax=Prosthecochloris ethylica TaxID=2743976 RepID=A0ABR9XQQ8_9CHLB|nr:MULTISPECIES: hydroxyacylglutathione hydrolase family protein [Prosthecochloris]MEC9486165.1 MBL fold metallo-hydrolase [Prosthecochloris sp.]MBF0586395.1 MBL fold metallo-hydrolase [Prosthecochloris ethylica]MBF0636387.1 MBL fold metallo-hydrolase [Prosthecochloris ethylica]NUK47561.1 MBL fold metallo-hydrolase [Prosthecochloris ethylica]RNA64190.1 MBL fold metallo-hydrolase [Prosthecochloris sp. ZM_2]